MVGLNQPYQTLTPPNLKDRHALDNDDLGLHLAAALAPLVHNLTGVRVKPGFVKVVSIALILTLTLTLTLALTPTHTPTSEP